MRLILDVLRYVFFHHNQNGMRISFCFHPWMGVGVSVGCGVWVWTAYYGVQPYSYPIFTPSLFPLPFFGYNPPQIQILIPPPPPNTHTHLTTHQKPHPFHHPPPPTHTHHPDPLSPGPSSPMSTPQYIVTNFAHHVTTEMAYVWISSDLIW